MKFFYSDEDIQGFYNKYTVKINLIINYMFNFFYNFIINYIFNLFFYNLYIIYVKFIKSTKF